MADSPVSPPFNVRWPKAGRTPQRAESKPPKPDGTSPETAKKTDKEDAFLMALADLQKHHGNIQRTDFGTCIHAVNGVELVADPSGTLYWPTTETLVVADLHLEKGSSFARRGQLLPPHDTMATLRRLRAVVERWQPARVIALGDSFHDPDAAHRLSDEAVATISGLMHQRAWVWITGNHDPEPPQGLGGTSCHEVREGGLILRHEPALKDCLGELAGHLHPKAALLRRGRMVRRACFAASRTRMILPSFGAYTGGLNVFHHAFDGMFDGRDFHALMCGKNQIYRIAAHHLS
ncbi:MAG: ligase-associated DNA damage response endonuclease PdeM [Pseudomonadota bacterium]